jgi:hypothetical protein
LNAKFWEKTNSRYFTNEEICCWNHQFNDFKLFTEVFIANWLNQINFSESVRKILKDIKPWLVKINSKNCIDNCNWNILRRKKQDQNLIFERLKKSHSRYFTEVNKAYRPWKVGNKNISGENSIHKIQNSQQIMTQQTLPTRVFSLCLQSVSSVCVSRSFS